MVLAIDKIKEEMETGELSINPVLDKEEQFQGAKVDLRLDNVFWRIQAEEQTHHNTRESFDELLDKITIPYSGDEAEFILHPGEFALAQTFEYVDLPSDLLGRLGGRSSIARQGIVVHATASVIDPGYMGYITLELTNFGSVPVVLHPRQRIAAITFERVEGKSKEYQGKFGGAGGPVPRKIDQDLDIIDIEI